MMDATFGMSSGEIDMFRLPWYGLMTAPIPP